MLFILGYMHLGIGVLLFFPSYVAIYANISDVQIVRELFLFNSLAMLLLSLGALYSKQFIHLPKKGSSHLPWPPNNSGFNLLPITLVYVLCAGVLMLYLSRFSLDQIALFNFAGTKESRDALRSAMGADFTGKYHWFEAFMRGGLSFCLYYLFVLVLCRDTYTVRVLFAIVFLTVLISFMASGEKGPIALVILGLILCKILVKNNGRLDIKSLAKASLIVFPILISTFALALDEESDFLSALLYRLFIGYVEGAYYYVELIPTRLGYMLGATFPNPGGIMPYEPVALAKDIYNLAVSHAQVGITGSFPTIFWAEAYANFGLFGIAVTSLTLGILLSVYNTVAKKFVNTVSGIAYFVWSCLHFSGLASLGLSWIFFDVKWFVVTMIFCFLYILEIKQNNTKRYGALKIESLSK